MNIDGITNGTVLDHIKAGKAMRIYELLHLDRVSCSVAIIQNAVSTKYGKKDIIKIDGILDLDYDAISYIDPNITINHIRNGKNLRKERLALPEHLTNVLVCKNPRCITSVEQGIPQKFYLADREKRIYRCAYCDVEHRE
ncbi:MAG: aspartate carbamoyltransferase regulatory subunit [Eubacteriales bacterium]|jgi:aspartate carbamoyltransferase regulatory subunit|nr:aspartate carbamoyltransferase regulatory subunit [Eubacteriales bacterium]